MIEICARAHNLDEIETILEQGFKTLEITLPSPGGIEEENSWGELADQRNLTLIGHGPNEGNPRDLTSLENTCLPKLRQALEAAKRLNVALLTIHFNVDTRWIPPETIQGKIDFLAQITQWGAEFGVQVNLENLSEGSADLEKALRMVPDLGLTLDVGHAMLTHRTSTAPDIITQLFDRISHLHLHDNHGGKSYRNDEHLIPGELKERGYKKTATLELAPHEMALGQERIAAFWRSSP
ncbi:MAG: sugar phosphate isomerase/epimerase [Deltaproteobacteria bacterium]|nr:sugar phosphate isomerase/epimerase [Deltaproteobacteria bacterium]